MLSKSKAIPLLGLMGMLIGGGGAVGLSLFLPEYAASKIESKMTRLEKRLDARIEFSTFERKGMFGGQITDLRVSDQKNGETFFSAKLVGGAVSPWKLLGGKIAPTEVWVDDIDLIITEREDGSFDFLERIKNARKKGSTTSTPTTGEKKESYLSLTFLPEVKASNLSIQFITSPNSNWPIQKLQIPSATIVEKDNFEIAAKVQISAKKSKVWQLPSEVKIDISVSEDLEPVGGLIQGDTPIRISGLQPFPFITAGFESISFTPKAQAQVNALQIDIGSPDGPALFSAKTMAISPTHWNPSKGLGLEEISIEDPQIYDHISKEGRSKLYDLQNMFRPKAPRNVTQNAFDIVRAIAFKRDRKRSFRGLGPLVPKKKTTSKTPLSPKADIGDRWEKLMRLVPHQLTIKNASATVKDDREMKTIKGWAKLLEAKNGNLEFLHDSEANELRFNLDFEAFSDAQEKGKVSSLINWNYKNKKVNSDIKVDNLNLLWASQFLGKEVVEKIRGGRVSADLSIKPESGTQIRIRGDLSVSNLSIFLPTLSEEPIVDFSAGYKFSAKYDPSGEIQAPKLLDKPTLLDHIPADSPLRKGSLIFESGEATMNGIPFVVRPKIFGTGAFPRMPARLDLFVKLKNTPFQDLFNAVPTALAGPLKGSKFGGYFAWTLDLELPLSHAADMKWDSKPITKNVTVNYLPRAVDVRRLLNDTKLVIKDTIRVRGKKVPFRRKIYIPTMRSPGDGFISENMAVSMDFLNAYRSSHPIYGPYGQVNSSDAGTDSHGYHRLTSISPFLIRAILTTEDKGFWRHSGISFWALRESLQANLNSGKIRRGGSTIAMQFVKNMFLDRKKIYSRKLREVFLVYLMYHVVNVPRERILEIYFNIIEFGPRIYGIHQAAVHYFGKKTIDLSLGEVAFLVSIIPGPKKWHFHWDRGEIPDWWFRRMKRYVEIMYKAQRVSEEERNRAISAPPTFWKPGPGEPRYRPKEPESPDAETQRKLNEILGVSPKVVDDKEAIPKDSKQAPEKEKIDKETQGRVFDPE